MGALVQSENLVESETVFEFENKQFSSLNYFHSSSVPFFFSVFDKYHKGITSFYKKGSIHSDNSL